MDYWDAIDYILALPDLERFSSGPGGQTMSLEAMKALLARLGNPEKGRKTVHVTGSKGKGSTSSMIASVLHESGYKTALYTSPHLHDYVERISLDLLPVSRFDFADGIAEIRDAIDEVNVSDLGPVSTFGAMNALFFHLCRKNGVEWQVVEVGLGGTHDATNVFETKEAAVITAISLEHTALLGNTCAEIAAEKSGIITKGSVAVLAAQRDRGVLPVVQERCRTTGAKLVDVGSAYHVHPSAHDSNGQSFIIEGPKRKYSLHTAMLGVHQTANAATAVATVEALLENGADKVSTDTIEDGIANIEVFGRMEQLTRRPITLIDGAHNGESMEALIEAIDRHFDYDDCIFILGVNTDKNIDEMLRSIKRLEPKRIIATKSQNQKAMDPTKIVEAAMTLGMEATATQHVLAAITMAKEFAALEDLVCITGSLYVAGEAREKILSLPAVH